MGNIWSRKSKKKDKSRAHGSIQSVNQQEDTNALATTHDVIGKDTLITDTHNSELAQSRSVIYERGQNRYVTSESGQSRYVTTDTLPTTSHINLPTNRFIVAAIDFGTTYSGLCYAFSTEIDRVFQVIAKDPTVVLFTPEKEFFKFGSDAENYYNDNSEDENLKKFYYFRNFKLFLYNERNLTKDLLIKDITEKKEMLAIDVFSGVITYFVKAFSEFIQRQFANDHSIVDDVYWVLTVPAIWDLKAKQFMREAAEQSGIKLQNLFLALEPEAASIHCRNEQLKLVKQNETYEKKSFDEGSKYLILDLGGGTVDITSHEIISHGGLKEIHQASGDDVGGNYVNQEFLKFIESFIGKERIQDIKENYPEHMADIWNTFENKKRNYKIADRTDENVKHVLVKLPESFLKMFKEPEVVDKIERSGYLERVFVKRDKLNLSKDIFEGFFKPTVSGILSKVRPILNEHDDINVILVVGGLAESSVVIREITDAFQDKSVLVPNEPQFAVLKGAVRFGFRPNIIRARVCRYTYGIAQQKSFNKYTDPVSKKRISDGSSYCDDVFDKHVERGEVISIGKFQGEHEYHPVMREQVSAHLEFYASTRKNPRFVTDDSCQYLGLMEIQLTKREQREDGTVIVRINFSGTELVIEAREKRTGKTIKATCNFLG